MTAKEVPATAKEIQDIEDEAADEIALSQAIETMVATSRTGRKRTATAKMVDNEEQARQTKTARMSGSDGRDGRGSRGSRGGKV
jgi:hypothetical protein